MSCGKAYELEIEDLLLEPESAECRAFVQHCEDCTDCAGELARQQLLVAALKGEDLHALTWHPSDQELVDLRAEPARLAAELRARIQTHFSSCDSCRDAFQVFESLAAAPEVAPARSESGVLRKLLEGTLAALRPLMAQPALVGAALALLVVSSFLAVDRFGERPDLVGYRGAERGVEKLPGGGEEPTTGGFALTLAAGARVDVAAHSLPAEGTVSIVLLAPPTLPDQERYFVRIVGPGPALGVWASRGEEAPLALELELDAKRLAPGSHRLEVFSSEEAPASLATYQLEVR